MFLLSQQMFDKTIDLSVMSGFECEFVETPPKAVQSECPICLLVLREPYQATCCGKSFCKECIKRIKLNKQCPTCNDKNFNLFHNKGLEQSLYDFKVYCSHKSKGCEWRGELRELDKHLNSDPSPAAADKYLEGCPFTVIKCPLCCTRSEEDRSLYRSDIKAHISDQLFSHLTAQTAHIKSLEGQIQKLIGFTAQQQKDKQHLQQRVVDLEAKMCSLGPRQPIMDSASKMNSGQPFSKEVASATHLTGTVKPAGAEFTMTGFEEYKREDDVWLSPHFYTHPGGYKMCLAVYANGDTTGKSTHLSVRIIMMKGEFDEQLKWPFRGNIVVQLLSQEDEDHHSKVVPFNEALVDTCSRVVGTQQMAKRRWGLSQFLPHTKLRPKYLKNDSIKLRIKKILLL